jgi:hypothetical protein
MRLDGKRLKQLLLVGLPLVAVCTTAFLPLQPVVRQGMILIVLIWIQLSLLLGVF